MAAGVLDGSGTATEIPANEIGILGLTWLKTSEGVVIPPNTRVWSIPSLNIP